MIIVHGLGEHSGRYAHVAASLTARGYAVHALDYSGHGQSPGRRLYFDSLEQPSQNLQQVVEQIDGGAKLFLYGHSMGVLVTMCYALDHQDRLAGLVLSGSPLDYAQSVPDLVFRLVAVLNRLLPGLPILPNLGTSALSQDPAVVKAYNSDPLVYHGWLPVRIVYYLLAESRALSQQLKDLTLPLLIMHGAEDNLCKMAGSQMIYRSATGKDRTLNLLGGFRHEIHNEPKQEIVLEKIADWLDAH